LSTADTSFINAVNNELKNYINLLESVSIKEGLKVVMTVSRLGNQYMQEQKVWDVIKHDPERAATVTYVAVNLVKLLSILIEPYMPSLTRKILSQLNHQHSPLSDTWTFEISPGHTLNEPQPLIRLLTDDEISKWRKTFGGRQTNDRTPFPLDIRIGRIVKVELHPDSSVQHLFVLTVDLGNGDVRQIVSGLRGHYTPEELINQYVAILCNLKAAKFKGVLSQGMLLTAETTCTAPSGQSQQVGMNT
jgi:methionyl-tRNA synthetase